MAEHAEVEYAAATGNDYPAHEHTYRNFVTLVKVTRDRRRHPYPDGIFPDVI